MAITGVKGNRHLASREKMLFDQGIGSSASVNNCVALNSKYYQDISSHMVKFKTIQRYLAFNLGAYTFYEKGNV